MKTKIKNEIPIPIIVDIGDEDYVSVYDVLVTTNEDIEIKYRYTGDKPPDVVEKILFSILTKSAQLLESKHD